MRSGRGTTIRRSRNSSVCLFPATAVTAVRRAMTNVRIVPSRASSCMSRSRKCVPPRHVGVAVAGGAGAAGGRPKASPIPAMMADGCSWPWWPLCHIVLMDLAGLSFLPCEQGAKINPSALRGQQLRLRGPQGSWAQPSDHECAMLPICRRRGSTYRNRHPKPKSKAPGKGGFVGVVGQLGLLWGASVPTGTRERRLVTGIKISLSALRTSSAARLLQRYRNRPPRAQIEGTWQKGLRGRRGAAGVALGCFGSDQRPWLTEIKISLSALRNRQRARLLQRHRNRLPKPKSRAPGKGGFVGAVGQLGLL